MDKKGKILVPGIYDDVAKLTDEERRLYEKIEFDLEDYAKDVGAQRLLHSTKVHGSVALICERGTVMYSVLPKVYERLTIRPICAFF